MPSHYLKEVDYFFNIYKELEGKKSDTYGWEDRVVAFQVIEESIRRYEDYEYERAGVGVLFTVITILVVQGGLALFGAVLVRLMSDAVLIESLADSPVILEMTAVGGVLLIGLSLVLLDIKRPRVANFLPALIIAPLLVVLAQAIGIEIYPL